jgi:RNA polymerase-interacting CarD/CdnL/TRCF family regulator
MDHLKKRAKAAENWKQRANDNARLLNSGAPLDLAEIVASLTELNETRSLTLGEARTLGKARKLLVSEISEVIGEEKAAVDQTVEKTLKSRKR